MASQAGSYGALLVGGILLTAAISGRTIREILAGHSSPLRPLLGTPPASGAAGTEGASMQTASFMTPGGGTSAGGGAVKGIPQGGKQAKALGGLGEFDGHQVARWIIPFLTYARKHGWKGTVTSGYRSEAEQRRIYDSGVRPAAVPGTSNHEGKAFPRGAVDVTDAAELSAILKRLPGGSLLKWAESADPVHFSFPHGGGY